MAIYTSEAYKAQFIYNQLLSVNPDDGKLRVVLKQAGYPVSLDDELEWTLAFLKKNLTEVVRLAASCKSKDWDKAHSVKLRALFDECVNRKNITELMGIVIEETEKTGNYELRTEMLNYQKERGLYPKSNELEL